MIFYRYTRIDNPYQLRDEHFAKCSALGLTGRCIVANEGVNFTLEGSENACKQYAAFLDQDERLKNMFIKYSKGTGNAFPGLSIKVRDEIVSLHLGSDDVDPNTTTGTYLTADELHSWFESGKKFYIIDMRNDYEHAIGAFRGSILPPMRNFRELPNVLPQLTHLKNEVVVTVCTAGVRCEKASGYLIKRGFSHVYQLYGGIQTYMQKYPNGYFDGKLYVFDGRIAIAFNEDEQHRVKIGKCHLCSAPTETFVNCMNDDCHLHFLICESCAQKAIDNGVFCSNTCKITGRYDRSYVRERALAYLEPFTKLAKK